MASASCAGQQTATARAPAGPAGKAAISGSATIGGAGAANAALTASARSGTQAWTATAAPVNGNPSFSLTVTVLCATVAP